MKNALKKGLGIPEGDDRFLAPVAEKSGSETRQSLGEMSIPFGDKMKSVCAEATGE